MTPALKTRCRFNTILKRYKKSANRSLGETESAFASFTAFEMLDIAIPRNIRLGGPTIATQC